MKHFIETLKNSLIKKVQNVLYLLRERNAARFYIQFLQVRIEYDILILH